MQHATLYLVEPAKAEEPDPRIGMRVRVRMPKLPHWLEHYPLLKWFYEQMHRLHIDLFAGEDGVVNAVEKSEFGRSRYTVDFGTFGKPFLKGGYHHDQLEFLGDGE